MTRPRTKLRFLGGLLAPITYLSLIFLGAISLKSSAQYLSLDIDFNLITRAHATRGEQPQNIQQAQNLQIKGRRLLKIKNFRGALACFEESHQRVPDLKNLVIIGAIHIKLIWSTT